LKKILHEIISLLSLKGRPNLTAGILCLVAGMIFWIFNALNKDYSTNINYPLTFLYDTEKYQPVDELPQAVLLNMSGVGWNLLRKTLRLKVEPLKILLETPDQTHWVAGSTLPSAITDQVSDLQLNYVLTDTLYLNLDVRTTKSFVLAINKDSVRIDEGFRISGDITLTPQMTELRGPSKLINQLPDTLYLQISESPLDDNFEEDVPISVDRLDLISRNPPTTEVSFSVKPTQTLSFDIPISLVNFPDNVVLVDSVYQVDVTVMEGQAVDQEDFQIVADYTSLSDSTIYPALLSVPQNMIKVTSELQGIKIKIRE
jgi:hypothetical protein